jgi:CubicO group peptidase (beta-lactamase class C family)
VGEHLRDSQTDGFLVIHDGHIVAEHYLNGMTEDTPHLLMSVSKSVTSAVVGILAGKGQLDVEALVSEVVPELSETSFAGATVQHLLDMRAGTGFNEDYDDPQADVRLYEQVYLWRPRTSERLPEDAIAYFATLRNDGEHGGPFRYRSVLTDVLAWVVERAARRRFHQVVADELWRAMGAEFDADVTLDAHGNALADGGISATLRDMGRFGLLHLLEPPAGAPEVVPASWVEGTIRGAPDGTEAFFAGDDPAGFPPGAHYRNCWWVRDHSLPYFNASGIYGQGVFVHHPTHTVAVKFSSRDRALDRLEGAATATAVATIGAVLARG